jgi:hypothetical protein
MASKKPSDSNFWPLVAAVMVILFWLYGFVPLLEWIARIGEN